MRRPARTSGKFRHFFSNPLKLGLLLTLVIFVLWFVDGGFINAGADRTPPEISFVTPTEGATLGDGVTRVQSQYIELAVTDEGSGTHRVHLYVDNEYNTGFGHYPIGSPKWYASWNVRGVANGEHTLEARAEDKRGNIGTAKITVTLNNGPKTDFTPPVVTILSPADGATFKKRSKVTIKWTANDEGSGMGRVVTSIFDSNPSFPPPDCTAYGLTEGTCPFTLSGRSGDVVTVEVVGYDYEENSAKASIQIKIQ